MNASQHPREARLLGTGEDNIPLVGVILENSSIAARTVVSMVFLGSATGSSFHILDAVSNLLGSDGEQVEDNNILATLDFSNPLLAVLRVNTILVVVLEKAVQAGAMERNPLRVDDT